MSSLRKTIQLAQLGARKISTAPIRKASIKEIQKKFQVDDGLPVHLKGGLSDKILYQSTIVLVTIGLAMSVNVLYQLAVPKKN